MDREKNRPSQTVCAAPLEPQNIESYIPGSWNVRWWFWTTHQGATLALGRLGISHLNQDYYNLLLNPHVRALSQKEATVLLTST
jgi:hypothetical protein